jgi:hypothetical protein
MINPTIISGMMRSGSTWSHNVTRMILTAVFNNVRVCYANLDDMDQLLDVADNTSDFPIILKAHYPNERALAGIMSGKYKNIFTYRDPRDCYCSRRSFRPGEDRMEAIEKVKHSMPYAEVFLTDRNSMCVKYEDITIHDEFTVAKMATYILSPADLYLDQKITDWIAEQVRPNAIKEYIATFDQLDSIVADQDHKVDVNTQFHDNHITDGRDGRWRTDLLPEDRDMVYNELNEFAEMLGYDAE